MGYRSIYDDREKLFQSNPQARPVNQREVRKRLEALFSAPKKPEVDRCRNGHNWVSCPDGLVRCSKCKIPKPPGQ